MNTNRHGLRRNVPLQVKREVRKRSKNGCVLCRSMIYTYEHIEPSWTNARSHDPNAMCLLCPNCHADVTAGRLSKQEVVRAYLNIQQSNEVRPPHYQLPISGQMRLGLGTSTFDFLPDGFSVLEYDGQNVLGIRYLPDSTFGGVYPAISGIICNSFGAVVIEIRDNEIILAASDVDIEAVGPVIRFRDVATNFDLQITFEPPGGLRIDKLQMRFKEIEIDTRDDFGVAGPTLKFQRARCLFGEIQANGCGAAIAYASDRSSWHADGISIIGGVGIRLPFMGLTVAKGSGAMWLPKFHLEWV